MAKSKHPIPEGFRSVTPQLVVEDARPVIDFLRAALDAEVLHEMPGPNGKGVMHAAVRIGDSTIFLSDAVGVAKKTSANLYLYVTDVDKAFAKATRAGAKVGAPVSDMFWGDRWGMLEDPFGNVWQIATHVEDVTPEEMGKRLQAAAPPA
jgi:uncharacterized glyoxalase superfamily protein PhnB